MRATAIEIATIFDEREGVPCPIFSFRFHNVEVGQQQDRLGLGVSAWQDGHEATIQGQARGGEDGKLAIGEPGRLHAGGHPFGGQGAASGRESGVGLNQLLVEAAERDLAGLGRLSGGGTCEGQGDGERGGEGFHGAQSFWAA